MHGASSRPRVLIAGVGYHNLRDMSMGPILIERLRLLDWPDGVDLEDLSYGVIAVMQTLDERPPYDRIVFVAGVNRGAPPATVSCYRWRGELPAAEQVQERVAEAVMGVVSLDNLLIVVEYFQKLPKDVVVIEVEAADYGWGEGLTPPVERVLPAVLAQIRVHTT